jgi:hypothetical protein
MTEAMKTGFGPGAYEMSAEGAAAKAPVFVTDDNVIENWLKPVEGQNLTFRTAGVGVPKDVNLIPFYKLYGQRYAIYWQFFSKKNWEEKLAAKPKMPEGAVDMIVVGNEESDLVHNFQSYRCRNGQYKEKNWVQSDDWFRYDLDVLPDKPMAIECTFVSDDNDCSFDIKVDSNSLKVSPLKPPAEGGFYSVKYDIPQELTKGKKRICVQFDARPLRDVAVGATTVERSRGRRITPRLFGLKMIEKKD